MNCRTCGRRRPPYYRWGRSLVLCSLCKARQARRQAAAKGRRNWRKLLEVTHD